MQMSTGDQSPVIKADGDATVNYGLDEDKLKAILDQHEQNIFRKIQEASGDANRLFLLEQKLRAVQEQKTDLKKSLEEEIQRRKAADEALSALKGQLSDEQIKQAQTSLEQGDTTTAKQAFQAVVKKDGAAVALAAYQLGQMAEGELEYSEALCQYKKAVVLEKDNPDYLLAAGIMARTMGEYAQAQEWLELLLKVRKNETAFGLELAFVQHELAYLYKLLGLYENAELLFLQSLEIKEDLLGKDHPSIAMSLNNLAGVYISQERYVEAEIQYQRSIKIIEHALGEQHIELAFPLNNLAVLYKSQGRHEEAILLYQRSQGIKENSLGREHPLFAMGLNNLASLYYELEKDEEAVEMLSESLYLLRKYFPDEHPYIVIQCRQITMI